MDKFSQVVGVDVPVQTVLELADAGLCAVLLVLADLVTMTELVIDEIVLSVRVVETICLLELDGREPILENNCSAH